ncbi:MAG: glycosyl transferase family 1 [Verrucomicrobia bacterium]|nr:MAG: glycosyl transferase family 1 [Verrucomicrobiota bacterium]
MSGCLISLEDYRPLIGDEACERIRAKAAALRGLRVLNFSSTYYGGGVAETLTSMTLLMNSIGIRSEWRIIQGTPDYFSVTKKMHNALQGDSINFSVFKRRIYEQVVFENAIRNRIDHDFVVVHDPQPLPLIEHYKKNCPWIWRCHLDLTNPHPRVWSYLRKWIDHYDAVILSCPNYRQALPQPQLIFWPAIDPFNTKNRTLNRRITKQRLARHGIPTDLPIIAQISRFDPWKDPEGVIEAFQIAQRRRGARKARLVLLGNFATDDPEGAKIFESLCGSRSDSILVLARGDDTSLVNALQRSAQVVLQKSTREGFGLTVSEAMWKGTPVIGGNVGGIPLQIENGVNGFLTSSIEETADRVAELLKDERLCRKLGKHGRSTVKKKFLLTRYMEQYLDLYLSPPSPIEK